MSIVRNCPYREDEHCKCEIYYGEPRTNMCSKCDWCLEKNKKIQMLTEDCSNHPDNPNF